MANKKPPVPKKHNPKSEKAGFAGMPKVKPPAKGVVKKKAPKK